MSNLSPITAKRRRNELITGTHLVIIHDMELLKDATGNIQNVDGFPAIVVTFCSNEQKYTDKMYILDGGHKQAYFNELVADTGVKVPEGGKVKKSEVLKKRVYVCVQEVHHVNNEKIVYDEMNVPVIEYRIFKTLPFIEGKTKQLMKGDPEINGIASGDFVSYKQVGDNTELVDTFNEAMRAKAEKTNAQHIYVSKAIKLDEVKLEEPTLPTFEDATIEDQKPTEEFDYNQIPPFPHE